MNSMSVANKPISDVKLLSPKNERRLLDNINYNFLTSLHFIFVIVSSCTVAFS